MEKYGVKDLSKISGVTARTLHYYDKINLLKPMDRSEAGYRFYGEYELLRLQQILFYRELDFPLKEIADLLDNPHFDLISALERHKSALKSRRKRISILLNTIDHTINHIKKGDIMSKPEKLYEGLPEEMGTTYRKQAMKKYGKERVEHSERELLKLGKEGFEKLKGELEQVNKDLFALKKEPPQSTKVQALITQHYSIIRKFWGTSNSKNSQVEEYAGLGQLYVSDERYTTIDGTAQPDFALFLKEAMSHFAETHLK